MKIGVFRVFLVLIVLLYGFCSVFHVQAQPKEVEIDGLIMDNTKSKMGHDFSERFVLLWETPANGYNIVISDQSEPRAGSWILVEVNGNLVFKALLKTSPEDIENLAKEAVVDANNYLVSLRETERNLEEDMKGDGIQ